MDTDSDTIENLRTAYTKMDYAMFLETLGGRDDGYWQEHWTIFKDTMRGLGRLGTFVPLLAAKGEELRHGVKPVGAGGSETYYSDNSRA